MSGTAIAQAEANLTRAQTSSRGAEIEYQRMQQIARRDKGAVSQKDLIRRETSHLDSLARIDVAEEQLNAVRLNLEFTTIMAPAGATSPTSTSKSARRPSPTSPGWRWSTTTATGCSGYFRESQLGEIGIGDAARVTLMAYPDQPLAGSVESISWGIAPTDGTVGYNLLPSFKPIFQRVRLARRMPVRVALDAADTVFVRGACIQQWFNTHGSPAPATVRLGIGLMF